MLWSEWDPHDLFSYSCSDGKILIETACKSVYFLLDDPCYKYQNLTSPDRNLNNMETPDTFSCDFSLPVKWYRFQGAAGRRLPTECPPSDRCHTKSPAWLDENQLPQERQGVKTDIKVCFKSGENCCGRRINIHVKNCGSYFVYRLFGTPSCDLRYCGTD